LPPLLVQSPAHPRDLPSFPTRRSSDLKAGVTPLNIPSFQLVLADSSNYPHTGTFRTLNRAVDPQTGTILVQALFPNPERLLRPGDRKSTRLNSSHQIISYAVFCLKKKT